MLRWFIRRRLATFEARFDYDMTYAREMLDADLGAFFALARLTGPAEYRRDLPKDVHAGAKLVAAMTEDCGPCAQLAVSMGLAAGVAPATLAAVAAGDDAALSPEVALGVRFARATLARSSEADPLREEIVARWGQRALISLGFAVVSGRIFPTLKYALGHGNACRRLVVDGTPVAVAHAAAA